MRPYLASMTLLPLLGGCSGAQVVDRDAILLDWLLRDNAIWLSRDARLLPGKYRRMLGDSDGDGVGDDPYDFMRGTAGLFHEDLQRLSVERVDLGYASTPEAASVLILGDPHPENLSTFLPQDDAGPVEGEPVPDLVVAWADMDAAAHGPWISDVRRGTQGMLLFVQGMEGCGDACQEQVVRAYGAGYDAGIRAVAEGGATFRLEGDLVGNPFVRDLVDEAEEEGAERNRLGDNTETVDGQRIFATLDRLPETGRGYLAPTREERRLAERILTPHAAAEEARTGLPFRVLDIARRYGQGVSSWPATRFVILWDTGDDTDADDRLLNVREVLDPPLYPGPGVTASAAWASNAERLLQTSRMLWPRPDLDPRLGAVQHGPASWKMLSATSWYQGLDHTKAADVWNDGDADEDDLIVFARGVGAALAFAHARGTTASGGSAVDAILDDLGEDPDALSQALMRVAFADRDRTIDDHARFGRLLDALGPWLGADLYAELP